MQRITRLTALLVAAVMMSAPALSQKLYRWVDKDGNVHYSDQVPPEAQQHARDEVTQSGRVLESNEADGAGAEVELSLEEQERLKQQQAADEAIARRYGSESDIAREKERKLAGLDLAIRHAESFVESQTPNLQSLLERKTKVESEGGDVSDALQSMIDDLSTQLENQRSSLESKRKERDEIVAFYDEELARYQAMRERKQAKAQASNDPQ